MSIGKFICNLCKCRADHLLQLTTRSFEPLMYSRQDERRSQTSFELLLVLSQGLLPVGWVWAKSKRKGFERRSSQLSETSPNFFFNTKRLRHFSCEPLLALTLSVASKAEPRYPAEEFISSFSPDPFTSSGFFILWRIYFVAQSIFDKKKKVYSVQLLLMALA